MHTRWPQQDQQNGFTLLIAILVIGIILAIGLSILNITLKEYILSNVARESAIALNAADAGMECALYWDRSSQGDKFDLLPAPASSITCMSQTVTVGGVASGVEQNLEFSWGTPAVCAKVTVTKYFTSTAPPVPMGGGALCPVGIECTRIVSLGYNKTCSQITSPRTVERGLRTRY